MSNKKIIEVKNLCKYFFKDKQKVKVLENVSFEVFQNEFLCIVGPSGCGKTTLLRNILGLCKYDSGSIVPNDLEIPENLNQFEKETYRGTAYIQQSSMLLPWRTIRQNAILGSELKKELNDDIINRINKRIIDYHLGGFEDYFPYQISGGMRQRVDIIRALESRPSILFCDEPFSAIDFVSRLDLSTKFKNLTRVYHTTTIFVTHNIEEAIYLGDRVLVLGKRPSKILNIYTPEKKIGLSDAVTCRTFPEFTKLFNNIWEDLKND